MYFKIILSVVYVVNLINHVHLQECGEPEDCVVSGWNKWSECTQTCGDYGTRTRSRTLFRDATCGGMCPYNMEETEPCNRKCCPVDCSFTFWSKWQKCHCTEEGCDGGGQRYKCSKMREKLTNATCGGYCDEQTTVEECGYLCCMRDCILGFWTKWSSCDAPCEQQGLRRRTREVVQDTACGGKQCGHKEEIAECTGDCCPTHCVLGEWGEWSTCNTSCGQGTQIRERFVQLPECGGDPCAEEPVHLETRSCTNYVNVDCVLSAWSAWSSCFLDNGFCGDGTRFRDRTVIVSPACNGTECGNLTETRICYGPCCRRDCNVTDWSEWAFCSSSCGQGVSNRTRSVETWPDCGGALCPPDLLESRGCVVTEVIDCEFTEWSDWTACSNDCGMGIITRSREMITPAYCGGTCQDELTYEEKACETFTARRNCEVSLWGEWSPCVRNCEGGIERRNRSLISDLICGGTPCPSLTETRFCHETCEQRCTDGICSCKPGYRLNADNFTCSEITCPSPQVDYCPETHRYSTDCRYPEFTCSLGHSFNQTCSAYCAENNWILKGSPQVVTCSGDGTWTQPLIYCVRPNKPPLGIQIDKTEMDENIPKDKCFAYLSTVTSDDEQSELQSYSVTSDETQRLYVKDNRVCLTRTANYEEKPDRWEATFRSTDMEGEYIEETFTFNVLNANDPPSSVKLEPDTIPENSLVGTVVGCFVGTDDDPGQSLTFSMINSLQKTFTAFDENGRTCVKVTQDSQPLCATDGGNYCVLNRERRPEHRVTVRVTDDGSPPLSAIFDVPIFLSDANDKHTAVKISPDMIPENVEAGEALVKFVSEDEDSNQIYTYRIVSDSSGLFSINGDHLTASRTFDFEKERDSLFEIEVESTDDATPPMTITSSITIKIKDVNEAPIQLQVSSLNGVYPFDLNAPKVPENVKGVLGTVMVKDQDFDDLVEISILNNKEINYLSISSTTCTKMMNHLLCSATISIETPFNYEQENLHMYSFIATDRAGKSSALNITLEVINMNDPPTAILINGKESHVIKVPENELNFKIGDLSASDDDTADKHEFKITEPVGGLFLVEGNLLKTSKSRVLDFEHQDLYDVVITVTDDGKPRQSTHFPVTVRVVDMNEAPISTVLSNTKIRENSLDGSIVGTLSTSDPDNVSGDKQSFLYTLSDDSLGRFQLQGSTLMVRKSPQICGISTCKLDFEEEQSITVKIITVDNGVPRMQREDKFMINLEDANDPPTGVKINTNMIKENRPVGTFIGTLTAADVNGDNVTFKLQNFIDVFEIQDGNKLISKQSLDYERLNNYRLAVLATDNGDPQEQSEEKLVIKVVDVNEAPVLLNVSTTLSVREDTDVGATVVTWSLSDPDPDEDITVSLTDHSNTFSISTPSCNTTPLTGATDCTVKLILMVQVYVTEDIVISVTVSDKEGLTSSETIYVNIQDVNVRPTNILLDEMSSGQIHVPENTRGTIAILSAVDKDPEQSHTFRIVADPSSQFEIEGIQLQTKLTANIDFENTQRNLTLEIEVTDSGDPPLSYRKAITVIVEDVNEPPKTATLSQDTILENSAEGTVVGRISVTDPDIGQTHTMILVNDDKGRFLLEENVLKIADAGENCLNDSGTNCKLNFEEKTVYTVTIQVTDSGSPPLLALFKIHIDITDVNERPRNLKISNNKILIGSPGETVIGFLYSEDEDKDQTHSFELLEHSPYVKISKTGQVTVVDSQNLNEGQIFDLSIKSTDDGIPQLSSEDIIQIVAVRENIMKVTIEAIGKTVQLDRSSLEVEEDTVVGNGFAKLVIEYPKQDQSISTKIVTTEEFVQMDTPACENIDGQTKCEVELKTQHDLDYERKTFFDVTFETATDDTKSLDSFRIYVKNRNEAPLAIYFGSEVISVDENSQNQLLGQFSVTDPDMNDIHTFTIIQNRNFVITEDGQLFTSPNAEIDFESKRPLSISVTVRDRGALELSQDFPVSVNDVNEPPNGISLSNTKISEMSKNGSVIGTFIVSDPDIAQSHTFELLSDQGRFIVEGSRLLVGDVGLECLARGGIFCSLDFESKAEHNVIVQVTDSGAIRLSAIFVITVDVTDVNDPPRDVSISVNKVLEDTEVGKIIARLDATDDDVSQALTFQLKDNTFFGIDGQNVILLKQLDFETSTDQIVEVVVMDNGLPSLTVSAVFNMSIVDVNEPPVSLVLRSTVDSVELFDIDEPAVVENMPALTYIGQLVAIDIDRNDDLFIESLTSDIVVRKVECIPVAKGTRCTADVRSGRVFDFEKERLVNVSFICTDRDGLQLRKKMTLQIVDANDPPTNIYLNGTAVSQITVPENSRGILLAKLNAADIEKNQSYTYSLGGETSSLLVQNDELWITSAAILDFEAKREIPFTIRVTDSGSPPKYYQKEIVLNITDINEAPTDLYLTSNTIPENASEGYSVGSFFVMDPENLNNGLTQTFTFKLSNEKSMFKVRDNLLMVAVPEFDYEKKRYFEEVVVVSDNGTPMMSATFSFTVEVTDVNEAPTHLEFNGDAVEESANIGSVVGKLSARDPDEGQSLVFSVIGTNLLSVNGDTVVVNGPLDFEAVSKLKFSASVIDNGSPPLLLKKDYVVSIVDVNEPPTDIVVVNNDDMTISEGSRTDEAVASIKIFDEDLVERLQLEIVYGNEIFRIAPAGLSCFVEIGDKFNGTVCTTVVYLIKEQDYESGPRQIDLSLMARDKGGLTLQRTFSFSVVNIKEAPKDIIIETDIEYVPENTPNFVIGTLFTVDDDIYESYTYVVVTPWDVFSTSGDKLIAKSAFNFEKQDTYTVSVRSQDNGYRPMFLVKEFKVSVGDVNEKPSDIKIIPTEIAKETAIDDIIAEIHITDPDNFGRPGFQSHTCHVSPEENFQIDNSELRVKVISSLAEDLESFNITISCTDSGEPPLSYEENITISVVENVDAPKVIQLLDMSGNREISVTEHIADIAVGKLSVVNLLTKQPIQGISEFSLSETSQDLFDVKGDILHLTKEVDFEFSPLIYIEIFARGSNLSGNDFEISENITVKVIDINEAPTGIDIDGKRSVTENVAEGTIIGDLITYDAENYQTYTYSLFGVNYGLMVTSDDIGMLDAFEIDDGVLKVGRETQYINYEKSDVISVLINTRDSGDPSYDINGLVHLVIEDVDDPPSDISLSNSVISENSPVDTVIGSLSVSDEDGVQQATCEILNLIDVPFKISERSLLVVAKDVLDFETRTSYTVEIACGNTDQDGASLKFTKAFLVNITNVNEPPVDIVLSSYRVEENNDVGQVIAEIRAIDLDSEVVFLSTEGIDSTSFDIGENATLVAKTEFNFEEKQFHIVTIKAVDNDGEHIIKDFEIEVLNVNEAPTSIQLDNKIVPENAESSSIVGRLSSLDPDWNQEFTYTLDKNTSQSGILEIRGASLIIGKRGLDFETASSHRITVTCTDNGVPPKTTAQDFLIEVVDANDPPSAIIVRMVDTVPENVKINSIVASLEVDDPDAGQRHACHIVNGEEFISVRMTDDSRAEMVLVNELNYEEFDTLDIVLSCTDGEFEIKKEYTIKVVDVNEAPTVVKLSGSNTVLAAAPKNHVIGILTTEDEDFEQSHSFTISGQSSSILNVSSNNELILLESIPNNVLDSLDPSLSFTISVADNGIPSLTYTQTFTLPITLVSIQVNRLPTMTLSTIELLTTMKKGKVIDRIFPENMTLSLNFQLSLVKNPYNTFTVENNTFLVLAIDVQNIDLPSFTFDIQIEDVIKMEKETKSVYVLVKGDFTCLESMQNCEENEVCVKLNETYHMCNCVKDFNRTEDGICVRVNHCEVNQESNGNAFIPCLNGGTCIDDIDDYKCNCVDGFVGKHCETDESFISTCSPNPCLNLAECLQDSDGSIHCACRFGWTGSICQDSINDCTDVTCFHGGTCIDKHLTYLCACNDAWKGLRCEYHINVCSEIFCNQSNICVGLVSSNRSLCVETEKYVVDLECEKLYQTDIKTMQALLVSYIMNNGQFPVVTVPADRRRRDINHNEIQIYVTDAQERMEKYHFSFVVIDKTETPVPRDAVLTTLSLICLEKNDSDLADDIFCPSIIQALKRETAEEELSDTLNSGIIVGLTLAVLLLILCATAYIFWKKKKPNTVKPEAKSQRQLRPWMQNRSPLNDLSSISPFKCQRRDLLQTSDICSSSSITSYVNTAESVPNGSRAGYATMPMQSCVHLSNTARQVEGTSAEGIPLRVKTTIIQVAPAQDDNAYSTVV